MVKFNYIIMDKNILEMICELLKNRLVNNT